MFEKFGRLKKLRIHPGSIDPSSNNRSREECTSEPTCFVANFSKLGRNILA